PTPDATSRAIVGPPGEKSVDSIVTRCTRDATEAASSSAIRAARTASVRTSTSSSRSTACPVATITGVRAASVTPANATGPATGSGGGSGGAHAADRGSDLRAAVDQTLADLLRREAGDRRTEPTEADDQRDLGPVVEHGRAHGVEEV